MKEQEAQRQAARDAGTCTGSGSSEATGATATLEVLAGSQVQVKGVKLLPHERKLVEQGLLTDVTHEGATAIWLRADSTNLQESKHRDASAGSFCETPPMAVVYRPMGDLELGHLLRYGVLPSTQPYQTIVRGETGRAYTEKYLRGAKWIDSSPTSVIEFVCPSTLIDELFARQCKPEEGVLSHGLGGKGGKGLSRFNASLVSGASRYRIVLVKRRSKLCK